MTPFIKQFLSAVRRAGNYASEDGSELVAVIKADGSKIAGWLTVVELVTAGGSALLTGAQTLAGIKTFSSMFRIPIGADVAGAGTIQSDAAALLEGAQVITGANGSLGWRLPVGAAGAICIVKGTTAGVAKIWPDVGATINGLGANNAMSLASGLIPGIFIKFTATQWYSFPLVPS